MQPDIWPGGGDVLDGNATLGRAVENRGRVIGDCADLFAEPLHFYVFKRFGGQAVGNFWAGRRIVDANDNSANWICAGGLAVFAINQFGGVDGSSASAILVHCDDVRFEISRLGLFSFQSTVIGGTLYVGYHLHSGRRPNDHCIAADRWEVGHRHILPDDEKVFPISLERFIECASETRRTVNWMDT